MYYRSAEFYGFFSEPSKKENWEKSKECFQKAKKLFKIPPEVVEIPFEVYKITRISLHLRQSKKTHTSGYERV
jgi:hypothetical protein